MMGPTTARRRLAIALAVLALVLSADGVETSAAAAAPPQAAVPPEAAARLPAAGGPTDAAQIANTLDAVINDGMAEGHIPGAVLLVVHNGEVMLGKGYGVADLETSRVVDPDADVWRVMSLSKPVTAMAVLQLAEQGKLDLAADVNRYLSSIQLRSGYGAPITADQLLTHTAGLDFDLDDIGGETKDAEKLLSLSAFLRQYPPARVRPPGQMVVYSNKAFDTLGLLVEDIAGKPFADYAAESIFAPLGMTSSSFLQPPAAAERLVTAYEWDGQALDYVFVTNERGVVTHYAVGSYAAEKAPLLDQDRTHRAMLAGFAVVFLLGALAWPVAATLRRKRGSPHGKSERTVLAVLAVVSGLNLFLLVALFAMLGFINFDYSTGMPLPLQVLLLLPFVTALLALLLLALSAKAWQAKAFSPAGRALVSLVAVAALLFIPWLHYWNLLGWRW